MKSIQQVQKNSEQTQEVQLQLKNNKTQVFFNTSGFVCLPPPSLFPVVGPLACQRLRNGAGACRHMWAAAVPACRRGEAKLDVRLEQRGR